jgi:hypothetical protein
MKIPLVVAVVVTSLLGVLWLTIGQISSPHDATPTADSAASAPLASSPDHGARAQTAAPEPVPSQPAAAAGPSSSASTMFPQPLSLPTASSPTSDPEMSGSQPGKQFTSQASNLLPATGMPPSAISVAANAVSGTTVAPIEYEIPPGMRAPVVFLPEDRPLTGPIQAALEDVRREFDETVAAANDPADVWDKATRHADDRYRQLMGFDAFNQKTMQDAREAMRSQELLPEASANQP